MSVVVLPDRTESDSPTPQVLAEALHRYLHAPVTWAWDDDPRDASTTLRLTVSAPASAVRAACGFFLDPVHITWHIHGETARDVWSGTRDTDRAEAWT